MDHAGPDVRCFKKAVKLNHSLTHSFLTPESAEVFFKHILKVLEILHCGKQGPIACIVITVVVDDLGPDSI